MPTNEKCEGCGKNHRQEVLENMEEFTLIERAIAVVEEEHPEEMPISHSAIFLFRNLASMAVEKTAHEMQQSGGHGMLDAIEGAVFSMLVKCFLAGVGVSHTLADGLGIPNVHVTDEMIAERREWLEGIIKRADEQPDPNEVLRRLQEFLKESGIDPSLIQVVGHHGMYL